MALCASFEFVVLETAEEMRWHLINLREQFTTAYDALARSAYQRIWELVQVKSELDKDAGQHTVEQFVQYWQGKFKKSSSKLSEQISQSFITEALRLAQGLLSHASVRQLFDIFESRFGKMSPFMPLNTIQTLSKKTKKDPQEACWVLNGVLDLLDCGFKDLSDLKGAGFIGAASGPASKTSEIDLLLAKHALLDEFLNKWLVKHDCSKTLVADFKAGLRGQSQCSTCDHGYRPSYVTYCQQVTRGRR